MYADVMMPQLDCLPFVDYIFWIIILIMFFSLCSIGFATNQYALKLRASFEQYTNQKVQIINSKPNL
jgi:hypothetical protein